MPPSAQAGDEPLIGVVHLAWAPLGVDPLRAFLRSYRRYSAGVTHHLTVVLNGLSVDPATADDRRAALLAELQSIEHSVIELERAVPDLAAYGLAAREIETQCVCFLNSYSVILANDWLVRLANALNEPRVDLAGATASWESQAEWRRGRPLAWPYQLLRTPMLRTRYPRFPNPHVRTTAFMMRRDVLLGFVLENARNKQATYLLESGRRSITRQLLDAGRRVVVVGRNGHVYDPEQWPESATFRSGSQANLLVDDNRTEQWLRASPRAQRRLALDAWGDRAQIEHRPRFASLTARK